MKIISCAMILIIALLVKPSTAEVCQMDSDVCEYTFKVEYHMTMFKGFHQLKAENGKLYSTKVDDTSAATPIPEEGVLTMDGYPENRVLIAVNGQIPGPTIDAYIGQTVIINVENHLYSDTTTIHWHGLHQIGSPFMDGVPYLTQCPIGPGQSFQYKFNMTQTGTHWYHSHSGSQRTMGLYGAFIIRERKPITMPEHIMTVTEYNHDENSDSIHFKISHGMTQLFDFHSCLVNGRGRFYSKPGVHNGAPLTKYNVKKGTQYRFRVIAAQSLYPFEVSVDGHKLKIVATDGYEVEPYVTDAFIINPGERYDFIITANKPIGNYWIRGLFTNPMSTDAFEAILHYEGAADEEPKSAPKKCSEVDPCVIVNCGLSQKKQHRKCVLLTELNSVVVDSPRLTNGKWKEHFLNFAFPGPHGGHAPASVNGRVFQSPSVNSLYHSKEIDTFCNNEMCGAGKLCACTNTLGLKKDDTIQLVFTNMGVGKGFDHPIHMHGHSFAVVKIGYPSFNPQTGKMEDNPDINCRGDPKKNYCNDPTWMNNKMGGDNIPGIKLHKAPLKDTVNLPSGGYVVVRIKANNPGLWFMHCHTEMHAMDGMALVLVEALADVPKAPAHFPECRSFTPKAIEIMHKAHGMGKKSGSE